MTCKVDIWVTRKEEGMTFVLVYADDILCATNKELEKMDLFTKRMRAMDL